MMMRPLIVLVMLLPVGCGTTPPPSPKPRDRVMTAALEAPLLVDPDLSQQNARNLAIVPPGPVAAPEPLPSDTAN